MNNVFEILLNYKNTCPDRVYLSDDNGSLTSLDVYNYASSLAHYILKLDIHSSPIIVLVDRSLKAIVSFFAIALCGNYYLPIDENVPFEKLSQMIQISNAKAYLSFNGTKIDGLKKIDYEEGINFGFDENKNLDLLNVFNKELPLYLMFTSGSTGTPKGVLKSHENIISFVNNFKETFAMISDEQRFMNQTPFFFDASSKDIYLSCFYKSTLFIPNKSIYSLPQNTVNYLNEKQITLIMWVPSALSIIAKLHTLDFMKPTFLKYVFFVGEVFQTKYLNMWLKAEPQVKFFNIYGSTELAGVSLYYVVNHLLSDEETLPTGKPLKNNNVFLNDGEICIQSKQIALGYINDNEKNEKTFKDIDGIRTLFTGDYAFLDKDKNIVFSTRKDFQIKHLGYRIELQEIEHVVTLFDYVSSCCALFDKEKDQIILFAELNKNIDNPIKTLLNDAKSHLQFYMVPNRVIILNAMPLNSNGKIDRTLLLSSLRSK